MMMNDDVVYVFSLSESVNKDIEEIYYISSF